MHYIQDHNFPTTAESDYADYTRHDETIRPQPPAFPPNFINLVATCVLERRFPQLGLASSLLALRKKFLAPIYIYEQLGSNLWYFCTWWTGSTVAKIRSTWSNSRQDRILSIAKKSAWWWQLLPTSPVPFLDCGAYIRNPRFHNCVRLLISKLLRRFRCQEVSHLSEFESQLVLGLGKILVALVPKIAIPDSHSG